MHQHNPVTKTVTPNFGSINGAHGALQVTLSPAHSRWRAQRNLASQALSKRTMTPYPVKQWMQQWAAEQQADLTGSILVQTSTTSPAQLDQDDSTMEFWENFKAQYDREQALENEHQSDQSLLEGTDTQGIQGTTELLNMIEQLTQILDEAEQQSNIQPKMEPEGGSPEYHPIYTSDFSRTATPSPSPPYRPTTPLYMLTMGEEDEQPIDLRTMPSHSTLSNNRPSPRKFSPWKPLDLSTKPLGPAHERDS